MAGPTGFWYLDGMDLFSTFAIAIRKGTAGFFQLPERKETITHTWPDQHGDDVDTSKHFFKSRDISLQLWVYADSKAEFFQKRNAFISQLIKPGLRRLQINAFESRSFYVIYKSCSAYEQAKSLRLEDGTIVHEFTLTVNEPQPQVETSDTFIVDDAGAFIIT
jgi:hypothetical protein